LNYSTRAVSALSSKTMDIDPEETELADFALMNQLAANWDTLGWVMFRQGDFPLAEKYLTAAWDLTQSPVIGEHLVEVSEKLGQKQKAAAICNMALAAPFQSAGSQERLSSQLARLRPFLKKLNLSPGLSSSAPAYVDGHVALTELRMFQVPFHVKLANKSASAQFLVSLINDAKVEKVVFLSGAEELRNARESISAVKYRQTFPSSEPSRLIRRATLNCDIYSKGCTLILTPTDEAAVSIPNISLSIQRPGT